MDLARPSLVSDFILAESRERGDILTNLKLQKLLYYAQAWFLALNNKPLFEEDFEAWVHGPVLPSQYNRFRDFQWRPITSNVHKPLSLSAMIARHLNEVISVFGVETASSLEAMTHSEKPWIDARRGLPLDAPSKNVIPKEAMKVFYRSL